MSATCSYKMISFFSLERKNLIKQLVNIEIEKLRLVLCVQQTPMCEPTDIHLTRPFIKDSHVKQNGPYTMPYYCVKYFWQILTVYLIVRSISGKIMTKYGQSYR